jgi:Raf kinase inhibitor-like YbhB/YbcL family protein
MATHTLTKLTVTSSAFQHEGRLPEQYTCQGQDISPPVKWSAGLAGTKCYALIMDDPDAPTPAPRGGGTWVHWVAWNIPQTSLSEDQPKHENLGSADQGAQGTNSWDRVGYSGPCPPSGTHRYYIHVFALDSRLALKPSTTAEDLRHAMNGHILAQGELMGKFAKR